MVIGKLGFKLNIFLAWSLGFFAFFTFVILYVLHWLIQQLDISLWYYAGFVTETLSFPSSSKLLRGTQSLKERYSLLFHARSTSGCYS